MINFNELFNTAGGALTSKEIFTTSGTFTKPTNVDLVYILLVAAGGGAYTDTFNNVHLAGGGGEVVYGWYEITDDLTITLGSGGTGVTTTTSTTAATSGGNSTITGGATLTALGGGGGGEAGDPSTMGCSGGAMTLSGVVGTADRSSAGGGAGGNAQAYNQEIISEGFNYPGKISAGAIAQRGQAALRSIPGLGLFGFSRGGIAYLSNILPAPVVSYGDGGSALAASGEDGADGYCAILY